MPSKIKLVDAAVAFQVIPRDKVRCNIHREKLAPNEQDVVGALEDAAHAIAAGVVSAEGGEVRGDHFQHVGQAAVQG